jgi:NADH-quinone oxidoreductase subunit N
LETSLSTKLQALTDSVRYMIPEVILAGGILVIIFLGLFTAFKKNNLLAVVALMLFALSFGHSVLFWDLYTQPVKLFEGLIRSDSFSAFFKLLFDLGGLLTVIMSINTKTDTRKFNSEYYAFLLFAVLGAHLLVMSLNFLMVFISLEALAISCYVLAGYSFTKKGAEGSLKYFLFGSVASAIMLYGFSILFGLTGTLDFSSGDFATRLINSQSSVLIIVASFMSLAGFLYKIAAAPMHPWSPDVYEAAPMPVVAFFSTVPKLAGIAIVSKFLLAINLFGQSTFNWQIALSVIVMLSIAVGNFSALWQNNPKRMIAYSSIAQSGFLLIGVVCFSTEGLQALFFYSVVYLITNFAVLISLQAFEKNNLLLIPSFRGQGKSFMLLSIVLLIGLISLSGIPPTGGFTSKLFVFASLWASYEQTGETILVWLLIFGLLNTVISLFYYLKIPYYAFLKNSPDTIQPQNTRMENFLALILVVLVVFLFIRPDLLMGWLNTINFVL